MINCKRPLGGVIFDMDGLMFDTERIVKRSWDIAGERMGYGKLGDNIFHTLGMNLNGRRDYFHRVYGKDFPFEEFSEQYKAAWFNIVEEDGIPIKPGLRELLKFLRSEGYPLMVATSSSPHHCTERLKDAGLTDYFQGTINGSMVQHSKPHPQIYQLACQTLGTPPSETLALEDSGNGLISAMSAGVMAIMIPDLITDLPDIEPALEAKLHSLADVIPYIQTHFQKA